MGLFLQNDRYGKTDEISFVVGLSEAKSHLSALSNEASFVIDMVKMMK